jgi:hypothetical protein
MDGLEEPKGLLFISMKLIIILCVDQLIAFLFSNLTYEIGSAS